MKKSYLAEAWLVIVLCLLFGSALAAVQASLKPRIQANKLNDTLHQIPSLVPGAVSGKQETMGGQVVYRATDGRGAQVGWVIAAAGQGFADRLEILVAVDPPARQITGLYVVDQKETPGLGDFIAKEKWRSQFRGKPATEPLVVTKTGARTPAEVDGVTGATISSESVVTIVNAAVAAFRAQGVKP
jgi:electron transport complex protein RnfG